MVLLRGNIDRHVSTLLIFNNLQLMTIAMVAIITSIDQSTGRNYDEPTGLHLETNYALSECVFFNVIG